ncbi:MAG: 4-hydroxybenzoate polyprenyltransferase [Alphaproteobacteria bacterium]|nr:MAG: 4-hydroxybenzoate polyprenyltransferase [Alphaproteobacteria bacterium]
MNFNAIARLSRWDKPVGIWLLYFPCLWGLGLAWNGDLTAYIYYASLFFIGSVLLRSAGCIYNDLCDRDFDAKVERTAMRPLASGEISKKQAIILIIFLCVCALPILFVLNNFARIVALGAIIPVALYPWMKRITYWPQLFLGITFNWGILVGYAALQGRLDPAAGLLYMAAILWTLAYDTIYALQDIEDDMRIGVKSTAVLMQGSVHPMALLCYVWMASILVFLGVLQGFGMVYFGHMFVLSCLLLWQVLTLLSGDAQNALARFKSNIWAGLIVSSALFMETIL